MPTLDSVIENFVVGDDLKVERTISNIPTDDTLAKAWFTTNGALYTPEKGTITGRKQVTQATS